LQMQRQSTFQLCLACQLPVLSIDETYVSETWHTHASVPYCVHDFMLLWVLAVKTSIQVPRCCSCTSHPSIIEL
jgi:hypothetical protein